MSSPDKRWPPRPTPADRLTHDWRCTRRYVREVLRGGRVVTLCQDCGASDAETDDGPEAA